MIPERLQRQSDTLVDNNEKKERASKTERGGPEGPVEGSLSSKTRSYIMRQVSVYLPSSRRPQLLCKQEP